MKDIDFVPHIKKMFDIFKDLVSGEKLGRDLDKINEKGEHSIGMDIMAEETFVKYLKDNNLPVSVFSEENGIIQVSNNPRYLVVFDPLDGSVNYKLGNNILPYGCLIAVYNISNLSLNKIVASGAIEITNGISWVYDGSLTKNINGQNVTIKNDWTIGRSTPVYLDLFYIDGYKLFTPLSDKILIRNVGSNVGNLSYLLSNLTAAVGGVCVRPEEIGALYSLIKGAGGVVSDINGQDIGDRVFSSDLTYFMIGGNSKVVNFCIDTFNNN